MKKLTVVGRGTAGCISVAHFLRYTDWEIDWYFDPNIMPQAVGEGADLTFPPLLFDLLQIEYSTVKEIFNGYLKLGIKKVNWGRSSENEFIHTFPPAMHSYHFTATKLQDYIVDVASKNKRVKIITAKVSDFESMDSDYILSCAGKPSNLDSYHISEYIPVNAVHVTQCYWTAPTFEYTMAIARPYGWVFAIPLTNRCSIGYLYNHKINTLDEVKQDVNNIFLSLNIIPSNNTNSFTFNNYYHKHTVGERVSFNGNASFFLEPMEATSITCMDYVNRLAFSTWTGERTVEAANAWYDRALKCVEAIIMLHYYAGSKFDTEFWKTAQQKGVNNINTFISDPQFMQIISLAKNANTSNKYGIRLGEQFGTWNIHSFYENLIGLGTLQDIYNKVQLAQS